MAHVDIKVPSPGESINEVRIAQWLVSDGDTVHKDQVIAEIDSDKATLELTAEAAGQIAIKAEADSDVAVGSVVATIDTSVKVEEKGEGEKGEGGKGEGGKGEGGKGEGRKGEGVKGEGEKGEGVKGEGVKRGGDGPVADARSASPVARAVMADKGIPAGKVKGSGPHGRVMKSDVQAYIAGGVDAAGDLMGWGGTRDSRRSKMTSLRSTVARRLVSVKNETAMLTTFNEVDMSAVMAMRAKYKEAFREAKGVNLGFMSFFTKAVTEALRHFPGVNSQIDGEEIVSFDYADIGIAVSGPKGLMVPVVRNAERMTMAEIEDAIKALAIKVRDGKITIADMAGGTFTITNGGVFGSMMSTPIINPPQSAILGMHNIVERPVAVNGQVVVRPMMYVALSYDHRIIDGKDSVGFLVKVKEMIEDPNKMVFGGKDPGEVLLGL
ncbi:MAG: 2-oxoglutarate dehydrogenase complex dihydrolipoyllysine-residue succinyltransferase [Flavobacteriales bacterium]|jgi:2-oxoglutarate dehydrogenase E2 component (dihydrolipoamide succinyltransferase)|nr:2-oxoglutarate dehydrogenase complex dihydrolipoyllysine-residue succinyltransferase [Flavobacteriales bacterium]